MSSINSIKIFGCRIDLLSQQDLIEAIFQMIASSKKGVVSNVNSHALNIAYAISWYRNFINASDYVFCDGFGVVLAAKLLGVTSPDRYTPPDWISQLGQKCAQHGHSFFLLGAKPGIAEQAAAAIQKHAPGLRISGVYHGYFDKSVNSPENKKVVDLINSSSTHVLLVGFGMPIQEKWLQDNWDALQINVALPVGAMFDFLAGETPRGPRWLTDHGFEWLTRLIIEPRRLWRRYLIGIPLFFWRILLQRLKLQSF